MHRFVCVQVCGDLEARQIHQHFVSQSLYKAALYPEATRAAVRVEHPQFAQRVLMLQVFVAAVQ
jgi:hypothetical protein